MNSTLERLLETGYAKTSSGGVVKIHSGISREEGEFLQNVIDQLAPRTTLEIGLAFGISALFICEALRKFPGARHIVFDPAQYSEAYWQGAGIESLKDAGFLDMVEFHALPSHIGLTRLEAEARQIDFAFIDGAHLFDYALVDFFCVDRLLRVGGIVVFDDLLMPSVQRVCRYIITNRNYSVVNHFPSRAGQTTRPSVKRRVVEKLAQSSGVMEKIVRIEYLRPEIHVSLGFGTQCIAFRKEANDQSAWHFHRDF